MGKLKTVGVLMVLLGASTLFVFATAPSTASVSQSHSDPTAADYAYKYNANTWGTADSYVEWWYMKVSEYGSDPNDPTPGVDENYFLSLEIVNPWDSNGVETSTGVYAIFGIMNGDSRQVLTQRRALGDFVVDSTARADVHLCLDATCTQKDLIDTDDNSPGTMKWKFHFDTDDADLKVVNRVGTTDPVERALDPSVTAPEPITDFDAIDVEFNFERVVGWRPDASEITPGPATNPLINWVVHSADASVINSQTAPSKITWTLDDSSTRVVTIRPSYFRAYADKNWGIGYPQAWIWDNAVWPGDDVVLAIGGACGATQEQCYQGGPGGAAASTYWKSPFFLKFKNTRLNQVEYMVYAVSDLNPLYKTTVEPVTNAKTYVDQEGYWSFPHKWKVTFEHTLGCSQNPLANDRRKAIAEVSTSEDRVFDVTFASSRMKFAGGVNGGGLNDLYDPFHDFEALDATVQLSLWYCDSNSGNYVAETAPDGTTNWPIVAKVGTFEYGVFHGRSSKAELFAGPVTASVSNGQATVDYYGKNIGGSAATKVVSTLKHVVYDQIYDIMSLEQLCISDTQIPPQGITLESGEYQDGQDTLEQACTYDVDFGQTVRVAPQDPGLAAVSDAHGLQATQTVNWYARLLAENCESFYSYISTNSAENYPYNNVRRFGWCPFFNPMAVNVAIGQAQVSTTQGVAPKPVTFEDGSTTKTITITPGTAFDVGFKMTVTTAEYLPRNYVALRVPLTVTMVETGYPATLDLWTPVAYTYDDNVAEGRSLWQAAAMVGVGGTPATQVSTVGSTYAPGQDAYLRRAIDLTNADLATTTFNYWIDTQRPNDYLDLQISGDEQTWTTLASFSLSVGLGDPGAASWMPGAVDLSGHVGSNRFIQFKFHSDAVVGGAGVMIDNWFVEGTYVDSTENEFATGSFDPDDLSVDGGTLTAVDGGNGYPGVATFTSFPRQFGWSGRLETFSFQSDEPNDTAARIQIRSATSASELLQSDWSGPDGHPDAYFTCPCRSVITDISVQGATWFQYKVELLSWNSTRTASVLEVTWTAIDPPRAYA